MTNKTRPFTIRLSNELIDECNSMGINKTEICRNALKGAVLAKEKSYNLIKKGKSNVSKSDKKINKT